MSNYLEKVFKNYHRLLDYENCESDIINGVRLAQDIMLYNDMKQSSKDYFTANNILLHAETEMETQLEEYKIPSPLNKYIERIGKEPKLNHLRYAISRFFNVFEREEEEEFEHNDDYNEDDYSEEEEYYDEG